MYVHVLFVSGVPINSERVWSLHFDVRHTLHYQSIHASFVVSAEGKDLEQFDFASALQHWRKKKDRRIFAG